MTAGSATRSRTFSILQANTRQALDSLRKARLRTILGLVGIMIGISSVITMVSLGEIAKEQARKRFEALGTDVLVIRKSSGDSSAGQRAAAIRLADAMALPLALSSITEAAPRINGFGDFRYAGRELNSGIVQGVTESFASINRLSLQAGRFISNLDAGQHYCVIGAELAANMRQAGPEQLTGRLFEVDEVLFTIVGVLEERQESYALPVQVNANRSVFLPISTSRRLVTDPEIDTIIARTRAGVHYQTAVEDILSFFRSRSPQLGLEVITAQELIAQMEGQMRIMTLLLGAVGSISLIVGGIGIMNIMLVSVAERRREIAIRRALGARRRDIQGQFLIEAIVLTVAGGVLGILLGMAATWVLCRFTGWEFLVSGVSVLSGMGTAIVTGLFFGFQPAHQASQLDPVEGLQGE